MDFVTDRTIGFIGDIKRISSLTALAELMAGALRELGIQNFSLMELGGIKGPEQSVLTNFPPEWAVRYFDEDYHLTDPVHLKLIRSRQPFQWDVLRLEGYLKGKARTIFYEGGEFGLNDGFTFPIFNTNGYTAVASYATEKIDNDPRLFPALQLITLYFHGKYKELTLGSDEKEIPRLTVRERECLTWAGVGKSDWEIGEILSVSETTVHSHIENAKRRLGVATRIQAVVEAMRHHLIHV